MQDNSDIQHKLNIRHRALKALGFRPSCVLDMYAGEGEITRLLWRHAADKVVCIERDPTKAARIEGATVIVGDNSNYTSMAADADLIDCDAYGLVMPIVDLLPSGKLVVFTDGTPEKARKVWSANKEFYSSLSSLLSDAVVERSIAGNAFYGYGWRK